MGSSADADLYYGYMMPEREWSEENEDDDREDEELWVAAKAPDSVKSLNLSEEDSAKWNALPYTGIGRQKDPESEEYSRRYGIYLDAKRAWLNENPLPAQQQPIGSYEGEYKFLALNGPDGKTLGVRSCWEAVPVDFNDPKFQVDQAAAKVTLDNYLTVIGYKPPPEMPGWHLVPLYG